MAEMILKATGSKLQIISAIHVTSTQAQYDTCLFEFDEAWDGYGVRTAVFYSNPNNIKAMLLDDDNKCYIPWDSFGNGRYLYIGVYGNNGESYLPTQFVEVMYQSGANVDDHLYPPTPGIYEQFVIGLTNKADKSALNDAINSLAEENNEQIQQNFLNGAVPFGTDLEPLKGDGSDETTSLLELINYAADRHTTLLIPRNLVVTIDNLTIRNKSRFAIDCQGILKRKDSSTLGVNLRFENCSDFDLVRLHFDGNGANNGAVENVAYTVNEEHKHCVVLQGCNNVKIGELTGFNVCGDVLYISLASQNISIQRVVGISDTQIGRNVISIVSAQDVFIDDVYSRNFGHYDMPGGFDIEPNTSTELVKNVFVTNVNLHGGGSAPFAILASNNAVAENVFVGKVNIERDINYSIITELETVESVYITGSNVQIDSVTVKNKSNYNVNFIRVDNMGTVAKEIEIKNAYCENCYRGIAFGVYGNLVRNIKIKATMRNLGYDGVFLVNCSFVELDIDIDSVGENRAMITKSGSYMTSDIKVRGNISKRGTGVAAILSSADPSYVQNWVLQDLDFTGWGNDQRLYGAGLGGTIQKLNCRGLTYQANRPAWDNWNKGDIVYNTNPVELGEVGSKYIVEKWICIADGPGSASNFMQSRTLTGN